MLFSLLHHKVYLEEIIYFFFIKKSLQMGGRKRGVYRTSVWRRASVSIAEMKSTTAEEKRRPLCMRKRVKHATGGLLNIHANFYITHNQSTCLTHTRETEADETLELNAKQRLYSERTLTWMTKTSVSSIIVWRWWWIFRNGDLLADFTSILFVFQPDAVGLCAFLVQKHL